MSIDNIKTKFLEALEEARQRGSEVRQVLPTDLFDDLDTLQEESYEWAQNVLDICGPLTGHRSDLVPYALVMIVDDYVSYVLGYPGRFNGTDTFESLLEENYHGEEVWDQVWQIRREIAKRLLSKVDSEEVCRSLEKLTEWEVEDEPGVFCNQLSFAQQMTLRGFVSNGLSY